jgi:hypothetical protein
LRRFLAAVFLGACMPLMAWATEQHFDKRRFDAQVELCMTRDSRPTRGQCEAEMWNRWRHSGVPRVESGMADKSRARLWSLA